MSEHPMVAEVQAEYAAAVRVQQRHADEDEHRVRRARQALEEAREATRGRDEIVLSPDHLTLLRAAYWDYNDQMDFGAVMMDPKRPYGNGDVGNDLARLLPHLDEGQRFVVHRELPLVMAHALASLPNLQEIPT